MSDYALVQVVDVCTLFIGSKVPVNSLGTFISKQFLDSLPSSGKSDQWIFRTWRMRMMLIQWFVIFGHRIVTAFYFHHCMAVSKLAFESLLSYESINKFADGSNTKCHPFFELRPFCALNAICFFFLSRSFKSLVIWLLTFHYRYFILFFSK